MTSFWYNRAYGKPLLCSECESGQWHAEFPKRSADGMLVDDQGFLWAKDERIPVGDTIVGQVNVAEGDKIEIDFTKQGNQT